VVCFFFFQAEDGIRDWSVTGVQTCALPICVRKALGARRAEILFQFLMEAAFLTSLGGVLGIALGSGIGGLVHLVSGFPVSMPWRSEERRVGKECRARGGGYDVKKRGGGWMW